MRCAPLRVTEEGDRQIRTMSPLSPRYRPQYTAFTPRPAGEAEHAATPHYDPPPVFRIVATACGCPAAGVHVDSARAVLGALHPGRVRRRTVRRPGLVRARHRPQAGPA